MHKQVLVGPVGLRPEGEYPRVLEVAESALDSTLTTVGFDNLSGCPFFACGCEQPQAEVVVLRSIGFSDLLAALGHPGRDSPMTLLIKRWHHPFTCRMPQFEYGRYPLPHPA